jgi:hypothetical protein
MKIKDCHIGAKVAIQSALKPSSTTLLSLANSEITGHPFRADNGIYRGKLPDTDLSTGTVRAFNSPEMICNVA